MAGIRRILVTGATGKQGGALIKALSSTTHESKAQPFELIALTRNATSTSAERLTRQSNVKVLQGDLDDVPAIFDQISAKYGSLYGVFSVQTPLKPRREEAQGKALAEHAARNGVKHFVYGSADRGGPARSDIDPTPVAHFASKFNIEKRIKEIAAEPASEMKWTIIRPVAFMENLTPDFFGKIWGNAWTYHGNRKLQIVSTESVGILAAEAFKNPSEFTGKSLSLATDSLSFDEANKLFRQRFGYDMPKTYDWLAKFIINWLAKEQLGIMANWMRAKGFGADVNEFRSKYPDMMNFEQWLEKGCKFNKA